MTRRYLAEMVQRRLAGGDPSDDFSIQLEEINGWLDVGIAPAAMKNYGDTAQLDVENVADAFYYSYSGISLTRDRSTQYYVGSLPAAPYALPRGYDITGVYLEGADMLSKPLVRIFQNQLGYYEDLRMPPNKSAFWVEGSQIFVNSKYVLDGQTIRVRMAGSGDTADLDSDVPVPPDMLDFVIGLVYSKMMPFINIKPDLSNDGVDVK